MRNFETCLCDLDEASKKRVLAHLPELIVTCLESSQKEIPSITEIKENLSSVKDIIIQEVDLNKLTFPTQFGEMQFYNYPNIRQ